MSIYIKSIIACVLFAGIASTSAQTTPSTSAKKPKTNVKGPTKKDNVKSSDSRFNSNPKGTSKPKAHSDPRFQNPIIVVPGENEHQHNDIRLQEEMNRTPGLVKPHTGHDKGLNPPPGETKTSTAWQLESDRPKVMDGNKSKPKTTTNKSKTTTNKKESK